MRNSIKALGKTALVICAILLFRPDTAEAASSIASGQGATKMHCGSSKRAYHDFDGDCQSDLLWLNNQGGRNQQFGFWLMQGSTRVGSHIVTIQNSYGGYSYGASGDFNDDGLADLIWLDATESTSSLVVRMWINQGNGIFSDTPIGTAPTGWALAGAGDVNGDGTDDLIWLNQSTCQLAFWYMGATGRTGFSIINVACGYRIFAVVNRPDTGIADLIWQGYDSSTSQNHIYQWTNTGTGSFVSRHLGDISAGGPINLVSAGSTGISPILYLSCMNFGEPCVSPTESCSGPDCQPPPTGKAGLLAWNPATLPGTVSLDSVAYYDYNYGIGGTGNFWNSQAGNENDMVWVGYPNWNAPAGNYNVYMWRLPTSGANLSTYFVGTAPNNWSLLR